MLEVMSGPVGFCAGLSCGTLWAVLLWVQLPGQTPRPRHLGKWGERLALLASGGLAWALWQPFFGPAGAFFCLGAWSMVLLCLLPITWAVATTHRHVRAP